MSRFIKSILLITHSCEPPPTAIDKQRSDEFRLKTVLAGKNHPPTCTMFYVLPSPAGGFRLLSQTKCKSGFGKFFNLLLNRSASSVLPRQIASMSLHSNSARLPSIISNSTI